MRKIPPFASGLLAGTAIFFYALLVIRVAQWFAAFIGLVERGC